MFGPNDYNYYYEDDSYDVDSTNEDYMSNWDNNEDLWDMYGVDNQEDFEDAYENDCGD